LTAGDGSKLPPRTIDLAASDGSFRPRLTFDRKHSVWRVACYPEQDVRTTGKGRTLIDALHAALDGTVFDAETTEWYIRSTGWGSELPQ
jgi:hypothetical protein